MLGAFISGALRRGRKPQRGAPEARVGYVFWVKIPQTETEDHEGSSLSHSLSLSLCLALSLPFYTYIYMYVEDTSLLKDPSPLPRLSGGVLGAFIFGPDVAKCQKKQRRQAYLKMISVIFGHPARQFALAVRVLSFDT